MTHTALTAAADALTDAAESLESWRGHISPRDAERHDLDGDIARATAAAAAARQAADGLSAPAAQPEAVVPQYVQRGWLIEWPVPGGRRNTVWSDSDAAGKAIGCPHEPVFAMRASATAAQPVPVVQPLTDDRIALIASTPCAVVGSYVHAFARDIERACAEAWGVQIGGANG